jgi:hypothetical protein
VKRATNLLHLLLGIASLAIAAYFLRGLADRGKTWWQQQSSVASHLPRPAQPESDSDGPLASAANLNGDGVPGQQDEATGGADAAPAPGSGAPSLVDRTNYVSAVDASAPNHFLHRRFLVETYQFFEFVVPQHALHPEVQGTILSVATRQNPDGGLSVELLLMNDQEFARFVNHRPVIAMLSSHPSSGDEICWKLKAPAGNPQRYYLVFRNSSKGHRPSMVDADFTASFE